jgi:hypothetical protein
MSQEGKRRFMAIVVVSLGSGPFSWKGLAGWGGRRSGQRAAASGRGRPAEGSCHRKWAGRFARLLRPQRSLEGGPGHAEGIAGRIPVNGATTPPSG